MSCNSEEQVHPRTDVQALGAVDLFARCAENTDDWELWSEFMRRYTPRIKAFIKGTLGRSPTNSHSPALTTRGVHQSDLLQSTVVRLVENGCAAMKRFSGSSENELLAYLAVITRSVVRDCVRHHEAQKRPLSESQLPAPDRDRNASSESEAVSECTLEREFLAREVACLSLRAIETQAGEFSRRDKLIFQLYFLHGLSTSQIARCGSIGLSKPGVEKALHRLKDLVRGAVDAKRPFEAIT